MRTSYCTYLSTVDEKTFKKQTKTTKNNFHDKVTLSILEITSLALQIS